MKKITKILAVVVGLTQVFSGLAWADLGPKSTIDINISVLLTGNATLAVESRNIAGVDKDKPASVSFTITGLDPSNTSKYWLVSDQYLHVAYSVSWNATWGLRIYTDNKTQYPGLWGKPIAKGTNGKWDGPKEFDPLSDDKCTYGGLVNTAKLDNPTLRATLGWQVLADKIANDAKPTISTDTDFNNGTPDNNADDWNMKWAYVADKGDGAADFDKVNTGYKDNNSNGKYDKGDDLMYNYNLVAYGGVGQTLAPHPMLDANGDGKPDLKLANDNFPADGKYDVVAYLAGRFVSEDYLVDPTDPDGVPFVLPKGSYSTKLYVEFLNE